ncbi:MAG: ADOP family duplicated permease [Acidobacteria bacterium]|nr:ADOP family duplicated permease [Acidobacteriota bacterium]
MWTRLRLGLTALLGRTRFERALADELAFHVQARAEEWERRGLSPSAARRRALIELGSPERIKEEVRDVRIGRWLQVLLQDLDYGFRVLRAHPGITAIGVLSLALGMAVCIYSFSRVHADILAPLPGARGPDSLVAVDTRLSYPAFERIRELDDIVDAATAYLGPTPFSVAVDGEHGAERAFGHLVSPEYFEALGVAPSAGRLLVPGTERAGSEPVVVVSERFWRRRLAADPRAVGSTLQVNGQSVTLAGIAAGGFRGVFPARPAEIFVPVTVGAALAPELEGDVLSDEEAERFQVVARLASGVSMQTAEAALDTAARAQDVPQPDAGERRRAGRQVRLFSAGRVVRIEPAQLRLTVGLSGLLVGLVLSLACANLAGLLLARAGERRREMAVRLALGAGRWRLVRQLLTESVLLASGGGAAGLFLSYWLLRVTSSISPMSPFPVEMNVSFGPMVWFFAVAIAVATGMGLGLAPALAATRGARDAIMRSVQRRPTAPLLRYRRFGVRNLFVTYQVAVALMLLLTIGQLAAGYQRLSGVEPGFDTAGLTLFGVDPGRDGYTPAQSAALLDELPELLAALPELRSAAVAARPPLTPAVAPGAMSGVRVSTSTEEGDVRRTFHFIAFERVGGSYFETLGIPLLRGRTFTERDLTGGAEDARERETPVVINQTAEQRIFGAATAVGRRLLGEHDARSYVVVGVVPDVRPSFLTARPMATAFVPLPAARFRSASIQGTTVLVRSSSDRGAMSAVRDELRRTEPRLTIFDARTMDEHLERFERSIRTAVGPLAGLSLFGLVLATIGLTGVTSYAVARRRSEIGIRLALGAERLHVLWLVLREGTFLVVAGAVLGAAGAFALSRALSALDPDLAQVLGAYVGDPVLLVGAPMLLVAVALLACAVPAWRAVRIDPASTLRAE